MLEYLRKRQGEAKAQETEKEQAAVPAGAGNQAMLSMLEAQGERGEVQPASGGTPLAEAMREKFERHFGLPMDDVRVHRNSDEPAKFDAGAYTYGTDIFIGPGQENLLSHEMTHVAQQKLGQVRPTGMEHGMAVNRSPALEHSADAGSVAQTAGTAAGPVVQYGKPKKGKERRGRKSSAAPPATQRRVAAAEPTVPTELLARIFSCRNEKVGGGASSDARFQRFMKEHEKPEWPKDSERILSHAFLGTDAKTKKKTTDPVGIHAYLVDGARNGRILPDDVYPERIIGDPRAVHVLVWHRKGSGGKKEEKRKSSTMFPISESMEAAAAAFFDDTCTGREKVARVGDTRYPTMRPETIGLSEDEFSELLTDPDDFIDRVSSSATNRKKYAQFIHMIYENVR